MGVLTDNDLAAETAKAITLIQNIGAHTHIKSRHKTLSPTKFSISKFNAMMDA